MAKVSTIDILPEEIRVELAAGLKGSGWGDIDGWHAWLTERGYEISRAAVGRFNQKTKARFQKAWAEAEQTAAMARLMVANQTDDGGAVLRANELLASDGLLRMQTALRELEEDLDDIEDPEAAADLKLKMAKAMAAMAKGVADLNKAGIVRAKYQAEVDAKLQSAAQKSEAIAKKAGLSDDDWAAIRANFLGVEMEP